MTNEVLVKYTHISDLIRWLHTLSEMNLYALRDFDYQPVVGWSKPGLWAYVDIVEYKFVFAKRSDAMLFKLTVE